MTARTPREPKRRARWRIVHGDCLEVLAGLAPDSVDAVVTDPPYGINFNGMAWDGRSIAEATRSDLALRERLGTPGRTDGGSAFGSASAYAGAYDFSAEGMLAFQAFSARWVTECVRVLKPGGHLAAFASPRTAHRLACGIEETGLTLRDVLMWIHGQGFPKSQPLPDRHAGLGTALKPAYEPIVLARKPPAGGTVENLDRHGTGALQIDRCRIAGRRPATAGVPNTRAGARAVAVQGRWPANLAFSHGPACDERRCQEDCPIARLGGRERFFYCPKISRREREAGCEQLAHSTIQTFQIGAENERRASANPVANIHPTVKPLDLMRWLVRLIAPAGGLVLDPFAGSGSTGAAALLEGARFLGVEREAAYVPIAKARLRYWTAARQTPRRRRSPHPSPRPRPRR